MLIFSCRADKSKHINATKMTFLGLVGDSRENFSLRKESFFSIGFRLLHVNDFIAELSLESEYQRIFLNFT